MKIDILNRGDAQSYMEEWINNYPTMPEIKPEYNSLRKKIQSINENVRKNAVNIESRKHDYYIDVHVGLELYEYLWSVPGFNMRTAADDGFWRFLSVIVAPDVVSQRWGKDNHAHFWSQPRRVWFRTIWWFVHLSWQGDYRKTKELLNKSQFTTDTILNFTERSGKKGTCISAYRWIIYYYGMVQEEHLKKFNRNKKAGNDDLFRKIMKLNTARMMVMEPGLCIGGEKAYAKELYEYLGVDFSAS